MQLKELKPYGVFIGICTLSLLVAGFCALFYFQYTSELNIKDIDERDISLEITLPIIEWGKYESLSKQYLNGKISISK